MSFICDECFKGAKEIGEVISGYWLMFHENKYSIVYGEGHDILLSFEEKPEPEPTEEETRCSETDIWYDWFDKAQKLENINISIQDSYDLIDAGINSGYSQLMDGTFVYWFFDRCGKLIKEKEDNCEAS